MHNPKKKNLHSYQKPVDWLEYLNNCLPALVIPVGPRFQAHVPEWTAPSNETCLNGNKDTSKWLGTKIWPLKDGISIKAGREIGSGRPDSCSCSSPGSSQCISHHISEESKKLQSDLGPAFKSWKFDEMGENVAKSWTSMERKKFDLLLRTIPRSRGKSFLKPAETSFPSKTREDIVSYYLNVYIPKSISIMTRSGSQVLDSDADEVEETPNMKNSLKRSRVVNSTILAKSHYLTGRR